MLPISAALSDRHLDVECRGAQEAIAGYAASHPRAWATLAPVFEQTLGAPVQELPLVALELADRRR